MYKSEINFYEISLIYQSINYLFYQWLIFIFIIYYYISLISFKIFKIKRDFFFFITGKVTI